MDFKIQTKSYVIGSIILKHISKSSVIGSMILKLIFKYVVIGSMILKLILKLSVILFFLIKRNCITKAVLHSNIGVHYRQGES